MSMLNTAPRHTDGLVLRPEISDTTTASSSLATYDLGKYPIHNKTSKTRAFIVNGNCILVGFTENTEFYGTPLSDAESINSTDGIRINPWIASIQVTKPGADLFNLIAFRCWLDAPASSSAADFPQALTRANPYLIPEKRSEAKRTALLSLLDRWLSEDKSEDENSSLEATIKSLDANRVGARKLFAEK